MINDLSDHRAKLYFEKPSLDTKIKLAVYGCGGHARSLADVALSNGHSNLIFVDEKANINETLFGFDVLKQWKIEQDAYVILALGDNLKRADLFQKLVDSECIVPIVAEDVHWGRNARLETGVFVGRGVHLGPNAFIGANTIINTHCVVEHDCKIGRHCHISVNSTVAGSCRIGDFVMIGVGATVIDGVSICSHVMIGAGAVVVNDITEPGVYVGVPAVQKSRANNVRK